MNKPTFVKDSHFFEHAPNLGAVGGKSNEALSSDDVGVTECSDDFIWQIFVGVIYRADDLFDFVVRFDEIWLLMYENVVKFWLVNE